MIIPSSKTIVKSSFQPVATSVHKGTSDHVRKQQWLPHLGAGECYWHLVDRGQGCCWMCDNAQDGPRPPRIVLPNVSIALRFRKPDWKPGWSVSTRDHTNTTSAGHLSHLGLRLGFSFADSGDWCVRSWLRERPKIQTPVLRLAQCHRGSENQSWPGPELTFSLKYHDTQK